MLYFFMLVYFDFDWFPVIDLTSKYVCMLIDLPMVCSGMLICHHYVNWEGTRS